MSTGQQLFPDVNGIVLVNAILHKAPRPPTDINPQIAIGLEAVILKALDKDPGRRYQSAKELVVDLNRLSAPVPLMTALHPKHRTRRIMLMIWGAVLVIAGVLAFELWRPLQQEPKRQAVLIVDFENRTGETVFDHTVSE